MKAIARRFAAVLTALIVLSLLAPASITHSHASDANRTIKVGFFAYPGYHEIEGKARSGYGYDFLCLLQRYADLNYEYVGYDKSWEDMQQMLLDGEIDMVTSARKTHEREEIFDFSEPIGTNSALITVRADDDRFIPGNYGALNGIVIGELSGNSRNSDVEEFALEKGFTYSVREYDTAEELEQALSNKRVDAIATSSLRRSSGEKIIAEFAPQDFYCIVKKGNTELLNEINYGISQMDINEGNWRDNLYYNNYRMSAQSTLVFTAKEQEYINAVLRGEKTVTAAAQPDANPYSFVDGGELTGIIPDYFAHLMDMAGLPYTVLVAKDRGEFHEWVNNNYADVIMDFRFGSVINDISEFGLVTDEYFQLTTSRVTRKGFNGDVKRIAIVDSWGIQCAEEDNLESAEMVNYPSREDALKAVKDGEADVCYVYTYTAEKFINVDPDSNLQFNILKNPVYSEHIYINPNTDHELCSILNKCIKADTSGILDEYVKRYTTVTYENLSLLQYLKLHTEVVALIVVLLIIVAVIVIWIVFKSRITRIKNKQLEKELDQQQKLEEALTFTNYFLGTYMSAYYVDLKTLNCQIYKRTERLEEKYPVINDYLESLTLYIETDVHPDDREALYAVTKPEQMRQMLKEHGEYTHMFRDISDGVEKIYKMQVIRGADENHAAFGFANVTEEVKEQQKHLLGAVPLSADILYKANIGLWAFELDEGAAPRMYVDDAMLGLIGLDHQVTPEETYHAWYDHIDEGSYGLVSDAVDNMMTAHAEVQYPWHHPDGRTFIVRCGGVRNPEYTKGIRIEGTHQNVTEVLHYDEAERRKKRESLAITLMSVLSDTYASLYYVVPETGEYQLITRDAEYSDKVDTKLIHGGNFYKDSYESTAEVIYSEDMDRMYMFSSRESIESAFGDNDSFSVDYRLNIDGEPIWYRMKTARIMSDDGAPHYAMGIKRIQEELEYQEKLEAANKAKTEFLFNMSHDIRTPMNAIIGFTQLAKKHIDDRDRVVDSLNKIESSGNHLLELINEVLDMSRVEAGKLHSEMKPVDVVEAARRLVTICKEGAIKQGIEITLEEKNIVHHTAIADELHVNQIIMNILGNAVKYTKAGGRVHYVVEETDSDVPGYGRYVFTIEDNGIGMSPEFLKHIYESFAREDKASTSKIQGTGLGMSIVKRLVEYMDGTIDIESEQGKGTKVTVTLQFQLTEADSSREEPASENLIALEGKRALLVEDNDLNREIATDMLNDHGVIVDEAESGPEAIRRVTEHGATYYDFVLMDIQMPMMDGYEATAQIRKLPGADKLPIIALSANAFDEDKRRSIEAGMNDHVSKPIVISKLMATLGKYIH